MSVLTAVLDAARSGAVQVVDLTTPLQASTPILELPPPFANTRRFELEELSRYDDRGPAWYWNDIHTGEHTGTHLDAPVHWITGQDGPDVSQAPLSTLVGAAAVIDMTDRVAADPDFLLEVEHVQ
ncbi:MAG TPA: cyclase family protein, partial [Pseudonocardia sp.]|nr:cyclase family protein [Pseudonocardia sp.]